MTADTQIVEDRPVEWQTTAEEAIAAAPGKAVQLMAAYLDRLDGIIIQQTAALQVIRLDPKIRTWLQDHDPKALAQVTEAIDAAPDWQIDNARPDYMAEGTKAREAALAAHAARRERLAGEWDPKALAAKIMATPKPHVALVTELEELVGQENMSQKTRALCEAYAEAAKAKEIAQR